MLRYTEWLGISLFIGLSFSLMTDSHAYNKAELDAAARGLKARNMMSEFLSLYSGDPGQLANRKDLLYLSYELIRKMEKGEEKISRQLRAINQKITRLSTTGTGGRNASGTSPLLEKEVQTLTQRISLLNDRVTRLASTGVSGRSQTVVTGDVGQEVKTLLPSILQKNPRIKKMEKEIATLRKNQKSDGSLDKGSNTQMNSRVKSARLIAGTSIAVTLLSVLFMAR